MGRFTEILSRLFPGTFTFATDQQDWDAIRLLRMKVPALRGRGHREVERAVVEAVR